MCFLEFTFKTNVKIIVKHLYIRVIFAGLDNAKNNTNMNKA